MSEFDYVSSVVLGVIQGLTEFLPISSSGHLAIVQRYLGLEAAGPQMLLFDVLAHFGTLIAVLIVFAGPVKRFVRRLVGELDQSLYSKRYAWRLLTLVVAATIPTAVIGLALRDRFEAAFGCPDLIGIALLVTGVLLAATARVKRPSRGWRGFRWWQAVLIGLAQAAAIMPGISRSGSTICIALFCGLRRRWAAEFSFLIAAPAILGASLINVIEAVKLPADQLAQIPWGPIIAGSLAALVSGVFALRLLLGVVRAAKLHYFAPYCWLLGLLLLSGVLF